MQRRELEWFVVAFVLGLLLATCAIKSVEWTLGQTRVDDG